MRRCCVLLALLLMVTLRLKAVDYTDEQLRRGVLLMPASEHSDRDPMDLARKYQGLRVTDVLDALQAIGIQDLTMMDPSIRPLWRDTSDELSHRICGVAVTYQYLPTNRPQAGIRPYDEFREWHNRWYGDIAPELFGRIIRPGNVVVIDAHDIDNTGFIGSNNALGWKARGMSGVVTNGPCRDTDEIILEKIPVYSRYQGGGTRPGRIEAGAINIPVSVGGVMVRPGDVVVADGDGVVVVPREHAEKVNEIAWDIAGGDKRGRRKLYDSLNMEYDATVSGSRGEAETGGMGTRGDAGPLYRATWESLSRHEPAPEWFRDAKFGIYCHWGVYSVPAFGSEWYPRNMHLEGTREHDNHLRKYGHPSEFGYHDFVPMFKAERFDAAEWAALFDEAGARFAGLVAEHHDGFSMWASEVNPWNVKEKGPERDLCGELARAFKARGMKFIATFHHARLLQRNADRPDNWDGFESHYPFHPDYPTSSTDPLLRKLYGHMAVDEFHQYWLAKLVEVIDRYEPDIIWFDSWLNLIPESYRRQFCAYYLNKAQSRDKEVVITYKQIDLPKSVGVLDIEKGGQADRTDETWLTDDTISRGSWCYTEDLKIKPARMVLHSLIDIVSKNGVLLLNISPRADGIIPGEQQQVLRTLGGWLKKYGEAIYGTRAWHVYGFGPTGYEKGQHGGVATTTAFTAQDVRFTWSRERNSIYIVFLGAPEAGSRVELRAFSFHRYPAPSPIEKITLLGTGIEAEWEISDETCFLTIPDAPMDDMAVVFKMHLE